MRLRCLVVVAGVGLVAANWIEAQTFKYCAFGDSITVGKCDGENPDCDEPLTVPPVSIVGYPHDLRELLGCTGAANSCEIYNYGLGAEETKDGVTRIDNVLTEQDFDVLLLMEGTNDICCRSVSDDTIKANLREIQNKATAAGVDTVYASIIRIHPDGQQFSTNKQNRIANLRNDLVGIAASDDRWFADPWWDLCPEWPCFNNHYAHPNDNGLHPDASGYLVMANEFEDAIKQHPVPPAPTLQSPGNGTEAQSPTLTWSTTAHTTWYQVHFDDSDQPWLEAQANCGGGTCSWTIPGLSSGNHRWQVGGRNPNGRSPWSSEWTFTCSNLNIANGTVFSGSATRSACHTITAASVTVAGSNGNLTLDAGVRIKLRNGFTVEAGGELHARVGP